MKCAKCKAHDVTLEHVRGCFGVGSLKADAQALGPAPSPKIDWASLPEGYFALQQGVDENDILFVRSRRAKKDGKWKGFVFFDRLVGAPGAYKRYPIKGAEKAKIAAWIAVPDQAVAAAQLFGQKKSACGRCGAPLTDQLSREIGLGPDCREMAGWTSWKLALNAEA